jgi:signal transduction histidine kinase/serine phosphatase RsbU (regulator of sigma subunit)/DNA-binding NarL/FixJ family response regulator
MLGPMPGVPDDLAAAAALGGEMGSRILEFDWAGHPLGAIEAWPDWMRVTVAEMLASRFPIVLWFGDELFLMYNDAYLSALGEKHPAALGTPGRLIWSEIWDVIGPMLLGVMETGVATWSADQRLALIRRRFAEEAFFTFTYSPMFDQSGAVGGIFCAVHETTEKVQGERRLGTLSALASRLVERNDSDAVMEAASEVCGSNLADLPFVGFYLAEGDSVLLRACTDGLRDVLAPAAPSVRTWADEGAGAGGSVLLEDCRARFPGLAERLVDGVPEQALLMSLIGGPGSELAGWMVAGVSPLLMLDDGYRSFLEMVAGHVGRGLATARLQQLESARWDALVELDRAKSQFFSNVSHEFRTPLTLIASPLEDVLSEPDELSQTQRERLTIARLNAMRMSRLVNNLLDFARLEAGGAEPDLESVDGAALTADLISMFRSAFEKAGVGLEAELSLSAPLVVDVGMWERIVLNLLSNALKYTLEGTVRVELGAEGESVQLSVSDTGVGIPADQHDLIFTRFHRAPGVGRSIEGTGIGLAMVRELVNALGGQISVRSALGAGATFVVSIPLRSEDGSFLPAAERRRPGPAPSDVGTMFVDEAMQWISGGERISHDPGEDLASRRTEGQRVLIVDDNADMRNYLERVLSSSWLIDTATSGAEALERVADVRPDLILSDVMMPGVDGFSLLERLRDDPDLREIPVILLSARAGAEAALEGIEAGAEDYIVKPFTSRDLTRRVRARLAASQERSSRVVADERRRGALVALSKALARAAAPEELATVVLDALADIGPALIVVLGRLEAQDVLHLDFAGPVGASMRARWRQVKPDTDSPLSRVARTQVPLLLDDSRQLRTMFPTLRAEDVVEGLRGLAVLPLSIDGRAEGALAIGWREPVDLEPAEVEFLEEVAELVVRTCERMRVVEVERTLAEKLQDELLAVPARCLSAVIAARYSSSSTLPGVGGDWYDAFELDSDRVGVAVGDVVGHGIESAAVMSQLRSVLTAAAMQADGPVEAIEALDRFARHVPGATMATAAYAVIDTAKETIEYCCAGHPPPMFVSPRGKLEYLQDCRGLPLAIGQAARPRPAGRHAFPPGSLLLLYTDGLIERRRRSLDVGLDRLHAEIAASWNLPARALTSRLLRLAHQDGEPDDDMVIIAARSTGRAELVYAQTFPADTKALAGMRAHLRTWLDSHSVQPEERDEIVLAVDEAVTNACEHGSDFDARKVVTLEATLTNGSLLACVSDSGQWRANAPDSAATGGYGHRLMEALVDSFEIHSDRYGTSVTLGKSLKASVFS